MANSVKYSDLFLVTYLVYKNHLLLFPPEKNPANNNRVEFIFENTPELQNDANAFLEDDFVSMRIRTFSKRYKDVMTYIHNPTPLQIKNPQIEKEMK